MRIALIADAFPPMRTSAAVQIRDLSNEFRLQQHELTVILPSADIKNAWSLEEIDSVRVLRLRTPKIKDVNYLRRTFAECLMPFFMQKNILKSPLAKDQWDGVVWYSPSIFHGPFIQSVKKRSKCKSYLIIRDIFPQWAADLGLMSQRGPVYRFFNAVARYQYSVADVIGVQTAGNLDYFSYWSSAVEKRLEVLQNWLFDSPISRCSICLDHTKLAGRKIFVYAGNMGIAQGVDSFINLAALLQNRMDIGFVFVGRGSELSKLNDLVLRRSLDNVLFFDEIHPDEIPGLYSQCTIGLVALDPRHKSHNIPGKFLTYMQAGLPVLARINADNDLVRLIQENNVGRVSSQTNDRHFERLACEILDMVDADSEIKNRCRGLYINNFSPVAAVGQIVNALRDEKVWV